MSSFEGVDVGNKLRVQLLRTDVERGYIDFKRVGKEGPVADPDADHRNGSGLKLRGWTILYRAV